jgi:hypothetical protein
MEPQDKQEEQNTNSNPIMEETLKKIIKALTEATIPEDAAKNYAKIFLEHEIDESILKSTLLTHELLQEIGISSLGHRLK